MVPQTEAELQKAWGVLGPTLEPMGMSYDQFVADMRKQEAYYNSIPQLPQPIPGSVAPSGPPLQQQSGYQSLPWWTPPAGAVSKIPDLPGVGVGTPTKIDSGPILTPTAPLQTPPQVPLGAVPGLSRDQQTILARGGTLAPAMAGDSPASSVPDLSWLNAVQPVKERSTYLAPLQASTPIAPRVPRMAPLPSLLPSAPSSSRAPQLSIVPPSAPVASDQFGVPAAPRRSRPDYWWSNQPKGALPSF